MIEEGVTAPTFELPALVDGDHRRVALEEYLGEDVVILAFYPGDFNPACDEESDLDELDLFTMQKDVSVLGIGPDTLYAHAAFADAYDLHVPLLSDTRREVAEAYDVAYEDDVGQELVERAVFVVDHDGEVAYAWSTRDVEELPETEAIKEAIGETGGDQTAFARYRVGHAHYVEGRRAFTSAMGSYAESEWMIAQSDFQRAREEFTEADEHFDSAVRFVDDDRFEAHYDAAEEKATHLWQAADWLAKSASHYSSGRGAEGQTLRDDAERPLEEARALAEPIDLDEWPTEGPPERTDPEDADEETFVPQADEERPDASLDLDGDSGAPATAAETADAAAAGDDMSPDEERTDIDDDELAEIEAELAEAPSDDPVDEAPDERRSVIDGPPANADVGGDNGGPDDGVEADAEATAGADVGADAPGEGGADGGPEVVDDGDADETEESASLEISDDELAEIGAEIAASDPNGDDATDGDDDESEDDEAAGDGNDAQSPEDEPRD